ncbi:MAG: hypothetical protein KAG20_01170 [Cocleimonas sp.]|nr:hypothetical protein [Cocleimonas sp.]
MRKSLIAISLLLSNSVFSNPVWEDFNNYTTLPNKQLKSATPTPYIARTLKLNETALRKKLSAITPNTQYKLSTEQPTKNNTLHNNKTIQLPLPDGSLLEVIATEYFIMEQALADKYQHFKTWKIQAANGKNIHGRIDFTEAGFHAMLTLENGDTVFIDPDKSATKTNPLYNSFSKQKNYPLFQKPLNYDEVLIQNQTIVPYSNNLHAKRSNNLIVYRLALAATAEYTALNGGNKTSALSAMLTTINRVNALYERDLSIRLTLAAHTDKLIYLDSSTDPFSSGNPYDMLNENIINTESVIGNDNYDIGHLFGGAGTGGLALLSGVCRINTESHKAGGITGSPSPYGDSFNIDYVSHEIGHQLGATHTFNSIEKSCSGGNRETDTAVEPGSGSTVMSYAGICGTDNLQHNSDAVFNAISIEQINHYTRYSGQANCGVKTASSNNSPNIITGKRFNIPTNTPFLLSSYATDVDGDHLSYTWDQIDTNGTAVKTNIDTGDNPLFRSYLPSDSNQRYFPQLTTLFGEVSVKGETLPLTKRELTFATLVRDNKGGIARADTLINTSGIPFEVTSQNSSYLYHPNEEIEVRWNEAGTNWAPINCNYVDIKLLAEDGTSQNLLLKTHNDSSQYLTIPSTIKATNKTRIMVACSDNIFFALSKGNISINKTSLADSQPVISINAPTLTEGDTEAKTLHYLITLSKEVTQQASVNYIIHDRDIGTKIKSGIVNISIGQKNATISQPISSNLIADGNKYYQLTLSSPHNLQFVATTTLSTIGTVIDNEIKAAPITIKMDDISVKEGNSGITKAIFTVYLNRALDNDISINYETVSDTAQANSDFISVKGTLLIPAGKTEETISIDITTDQLIERNETFWLLLANPTNSAILINKTATMTIINDDEEIEILAEKETDKKAGGSIDNIFTLILLLALLKLKPSTIRIAKRLK